MTARQNGSAGTRDPQLGGFSRRQVLLGALAAGAGAVVGSGVLNSISASAATLTYDVVVVGAGASGMAAALTAAKRGLSVLVIEKAATFGGSVARSGAGKIGRASGRERV